jgi:V8-like Glu-specific endopeptidase
VTYSASSYPYDTVVRITDIIGNTSWQGSGVLISPDEVLTASHVVYIQGMGIASDIVVTPGYNDGSSPYGSASGSYIHYFQIDDANRSISTQQSQYDYAVIHLSTPFQSAGYMGIQSDFAGGPVQITGYPSSALGSQVDSSQNVFRDANYTLLDGTSLGEGSSGGPVWVEGAGGAQVVGLVSSGSGSTGYNTLITTSAFNQIQAWLRQDDSPPISPIPHTPTRTPWVGETDATTGISINPYMTPYVGPVSGLENQFIDLNPHNLVITATTPNVFLVSGAGDDALKVISGNNVMEGGTGSNFLVGGTGSDVFFVDDRAPASNVWSGLVNFHSGDAATVWGVTPADFNLSWKDDMGAVGYKGLTVIATKNAPGGAIAAATITGYTTADLSDGKLSVAFGTAASGDNYMYIHAT